MTANHGFTEDECAERLTQVNGKISNLLVAMQSNRAIAISLGIIIERMNMSEDEAFALLRRASQNRHLKIRELADQIVFSGEIPAPAVGTSPDAASTANPHRVRLGGSR